MGNLKDIDTLISNVERALGYAESAQYEASTAASEASDAESTISNVTEILGELLEDVKASIGFDKHDLELAVAYIKSLNNLQVMYADYLDGIVNYGKPYDKRFGTLISAINTLTTGYQELTWDEGYEMVSEWQNGESVTIIRKVKEEVKNG